MIIHSVQYRAAPTTRQFPASDINRMLHKIVTESAITERAIYILFDAKRKDSLRFFVDYRKQDALTVRYSYLLPRMREWSDLLDDATMFSPLKASSRQGKTKSGEKNRGMTAFTNHRELYQLLEMPFELKNVLAIFKRAMDLISSSVIWKTVLVQLEDNIVILCEIFQNHTKYIKQVPSILHRAE